MMLEPVNTQGATIKVKLVFDRPTEDIPKIRETITAYTNACNYISRYIFDNAFPLNQLDIQKDLYRALRDQFGLKSMMAQSSIRVVVARYKTIKEQLQKTPAIYRTSDGKTAVCKDSQGKPICQSLDWMWQPIQFRKPYISLVRNRDWSWKSDGKISINTLQGRVTATPICKGFDRYFDGSWKLGSASIMEKGGQWYLYIGATKQIEELSNTDIRHVVGVDRGLRFLAVSYDEKGKTAFFDGKAALRKREAFAKLRAKLQAKGTKSAKRALKRISGRENRCDGSFAA